MSGPWERYRQTSPAQGDGPWARYLAPEAALDTDTAESEVPEMPAVLAETASAASQARRQEGAGEALLREFDIRSKQTGGFIASLLSPLSAGIERLDAAIAGREPRESAFERIAREQLAAADALRATQGERSMFGEVAGAAGGAAFDLPLMAMSGGTSQITQVPRAAELGTTALQAIRATLPEALRQSFRASAPVAPVYGAETARLAEQAGASPEKATVAGAAETLLTPLANVLPLNVAGRLPSRAVQGTLTNLVAEDVQNAVVNQFVPDEQMRPVVLDALARGDVDTAVRAGLPVSVFGALMGATLGARPTRPQPDPAELRRTEPSEPEPVEVPARVDRATLLREAAAYEAELAAIPERERTPDQVELLTYLQTHRGDAQAIAEGFGVELTEQGRPALSAPVIEVDATGEAGTAAQRAQRAREEAELGLTPDVRAAQERRAEGARWRARPEPIEALEAADPPNVPPLVERSSAPSLPEADGPAAAPFDAAEAVSRPLAERADTDARLGESEVGASPVEAETEPALLRRGRDAPRAPTVEAVRAVVERVTRGPDARVEVVASFDDLPSAIRAAAERQGATPDDITGVHWRGTSYVVAGNLRDAAQAERTVFHEAFAHGGLRMRYGNRVMGRMEDLARGLGGFDGVLRLARQQGVALDAYVDGLAGDRTLSPRERVAILTEELLAHLNETRGSLRAYLEEIVGTLRQWLRRNGFAELAELGVTDLRAELRDARRAWFDAREMPAGEVAFRRTEGAGADAEGASLRTQRRPPAPFATQVRERLASGDSRGPMLDMGLTPAVLRMLGFPKLPLRMPPGVLFKLATGKGGERAPLTEQQIARLPEEIDNPVAIFDDPKSQSKIVVTTMVDAAGKPIMAAVRANGRERYVEVNLLLTAFGRDRATEWLARETGRLLYRGEKKNPRLSLSGLDQRQTDEGKAEGPGRTVLGPDDLRNFRQQARDEALDTPRFQREASEQRPNMLRGRTLRKSQSAADGAPPRREAPAADQGFGPDSPNAAPLFPTLRRTLEDVVRLPFEGAAERLQRKAGFEDVGRAVKRYTDRLQDLQGRINRVLDPALKAAFGGLDFKLRSGADWLTQWVGFPPQARRAVETEFAEWARAWSRDAAEGKQVYDGLSDRARALADAWVKLANITGDLNQRAGVQVYDPKLGGWRPIGRIARFFPRVLRPELHRAMLDPARHPKEWAQVVDTLVSHGVVKDGWDALDYVRRELGRSPEVDGDYFAGIERARSAGFPESMYDYRPVRAMEYLSRWADRLAQIEAFGQKTGEGTGDLFDRAVQRLAKGDQVSEDYLRIVQGQIYGTRARGAGAKLAARLNLIAGGLMLGNPGTATMNLIGGLSLNNMAFGRSALKAYADLLRDGRRAYREARDLGVLADDYLRLMADSDGLAPQWLSKGVSGLMTIGGYTPTERIIRLHAFAAGRNKLASALRIWRRDGFGSDAGRREAAWFLRNGFEPATLVAEADTLNEAGTRAGGPETDRFLRYAVNLTQGSYKLDQVPLWSDTPLGRFLAKYQKFGTQLSRMFVKNHLEPFARALLVEKGENFRAVDPRTGEVTTFTHPRTQTAIPLLQFVAFGALGGTATMLSRGALFGYPASGPELDEIERALEDGDTARAIQLGAWLAFEGLLANGGIGILQTPAVAMRDFADRRRVADPTNPPALNIVNETFKLGQRWYDQGTITAKDIRDYADRVSALARTVRRATLIGLDAAGVELEAAQLERARREVNKVRKLTRRYAADTALPVRRRRPSDDVTVTPMTPVNREIIDALLIGNVGQAQAIARRFLDGIEDADEAERAYRSMQQAVRMRQPIVISDAPSNAERRAFLRWAEQNLTPQEFNRVRALDQSYREAAMRVGLMTRDDTAAARRRERREDLRRDNPALNERRRRQLYRRLGLGYGEPSGG